jgi:hypothetical protein
MAKTYKTTLMNAIFIYAKGNQIKCFDIDEATKKNLHLIDDGWIHTHTLDPCLFMQYLHNECDANLRNDEIGKLNQKDNTF